MRIKFLLFSRFLILLFFQNGIQIMKYDSTVVERLKYPLNITNSPMGPFKYYYVSKEVGGVRK